MAMSDHQRSMNYTTTNGLYEPLSRAKAVKKDGEGRCLRRTGFALVSVVSAFVEAFPEEAD